MTIKHFSGLSILSIYLFSSSLTSAQTDPNTFTPDNAILDTSISFAIGAQEAQQSLRSSFGWATFQEGLVEGVYFRFDPDGYARFSPSPRLDTNVFEVTCTPRTFSCTGQKGSMVLSTNAKNKILVSLAELQDGDRLFVSDGTQEIEAPARILEPLIPQLEALLSAGGDLIIKRGETVIETISLTGFSSVVAYLRWVAARQDYSVLPRDWPIPNASPNGQAATIASPTNWRNQNQPLIVVDQSTIAPLPTVAISKNDEGIEKVQDELQEIRELLSQTSNPVSKVDMELGQTDNKSLSDPAAENLVQLSLRISKIENTLSEISSKFSDFETSLSSINNNGLNTHETHEQKIAFLVDAFEIDSDTADMILQSDGSNTHDEAQKIKPDSSNHDDVLTQIFDQLDMDRDVDSVATTDLQVETQTSSNLNSQDYQSLTKYFASVFDSSLSN